MGRTAYLALIVAVVGTSRIGLQNAEFEACHHQGKQSPVEVGLSEQPLIESSLHGLERMAALHVETGLNGSSTGFFGCLDIAVATIKVVDGITVRNDVPVKSPTLAQNVGQQIFTSATRLTVDTVVGRHDGLHPALLHKHLELWQIGLKEVAPGGMDISFVAGALRPGVYGVVLGAGSGLEIEGIITLQTAHVGRAEHTRKQRVFTVGFHATAPSRVAKDVYIGRPERETGITRIVFQFLGYVKLRPSLRGHSITNFPDKCLVKGGTKGYRLRKDRGPPVAPHTVETFTPPVVGFDTEMLDGRTLIHQLRDFLTDRHSGDNLLCMTAHLVILARLGVDATYKKKGDGVN